MYASIKKLADLDAILGKTLARNFLAHIKSERGSRSQKLRRVPYGVNFHTVKPKMYLGDYDTLTAYLVDLSTGQVVNSHYCGSFDSALNHSEQGARGAVAHGFAVLMVTVTGSGGNLSWYLDVISSDLVSQINLK